MARRPAAGDIALRDLLNAMDASAFAILVVACAPSVHPATTSALVQIESGFNPYAIGIVGGALEKQPRSRGEALATARLRLRPKPICAGRALSEDPEFVE